MGAAAPDDGAEVRVPRRLRRWLLCRCGRPSRSARVSGRERRGSGGAEPGTPEPRRRRVPAPPAGGARAARGRRDAARSAQGALAAHGAGAAGPGGELAGWGTGAGCWRSRIPTGAGRLAAPLLSASALRSLAPSSAPPPSAPGLCVRGTVPPSAENPLSPEGGSGGVLSAGLPHAAHLGPCRELSGLPPLAQTGRAGVSDVWNSTRQGSWTPTS